MKLPDALESQIQLVIDDYEEEYQMRYVTSIERMALERGEREGRKAGEREGRNNALRETVIRLLRHRFQLTEEKTVSISLLLQPIQEEPILKHLIDLTMDTESFIDFMTKLQLLLPPPTSVDSPLAQELISPK